MSELFAARTALWVITSCPRCHCYPTKNSELALPGLAGGHSNGVKFRT